MLLVEAPSSDQHLGDRGMLGFKLWTKTTKDFRFGREASSEELRIG